MKLEAAIENIQAFEQGSITNKLSSIEVALRGSSCTQIAEVCASNHIDFPLIESALLLKSIAGQVNVVIHAVGIITSLPFILTDSETVEYLSLGAGNTGRPFDLSTNKRIAEFKFTSWKGGAESIRQNTIFKDFYNLAEFETDKDRYLYVLDQAFPMKFFNSHRSIQSVLSRNIKLSHRFQEQYGSRFKAVADYYDHRKDRVKIIDLIPLVPSFAVLSEEQ